MLAAIIGPATTGPAGPAQMPMLIKYKNVAFIKSTSTGVYIKILLLPHITLVAYMYIHVAQLHLLVTP